VQVQELTESIVMGRWCQTLLYLGETPFPSGLMSLSRDIAMDSLPVEFRPQPLAWVEDFGLTATLIGDGSLGQVSVDFATYPAVLKLGYVLPAMPESQLSEALSVAIDALVNTASIVQDGFLNARSDDSPAPFDHVFLSEFAFVTGETDVIDGLARWIPEPLLGALVLRTSENYYSAATESMSDPERVAVLRWIADNGSGASVASAINTLAYSFLIPNRDFEDAAFYLREAIDLQIIHESTNAMANYGAMLLATGEREDAEKTLLAALEQPDMFAEGEASFLLGRMYREDGDEAKAKIYFERASASQDQQFAALAKKEIQGSAAIHDVADTSPPLARFCTNCGNQFSAENQKFCGECGERRD
jgi:tetratricopeptide (TPR) repeat protein